MKDLKALAQPSEGQSEILGEDRALFTAALPGERCCARHRPLWSSRAPRPSSGRACPATGRHLLRPEPDGRGRIHLLDASRLVHEGARSTRLFHCSGCWPSCSSSTAGAQRCRQAGAGTVLRREPHLLFNAARRKPCATAWNRWSGLIRSKASGCTSSQSPNDLPDDVLAQLSACVSSMACAPSPPRSRNRAARGGRRFPPNPAFDT
ncbi:helicase HerA-like domain-containing protein [Pseudomonas aeruginosa]